MKKFLAILLSALMMLTLFAGCGDKGSDDKKDDSKKEDTSASEKVDGGKEDDKPTVADGKDVGTWEMSEDGVVAAIDATYDTDTEIVEEVVIKMTVSKETEGYAEIVESFEFLEAALSEAEAEVGGDMDIKFVDDDDNTTILFTFSGLDGEDREMTISVLSEFGIYADEEDGYVYIDGVDEGLTDEGFTKK